MPDSLTAGDRELALEMRRRVKEQQKRIGSAEFRNTQFSYSMGLDGIEHFVSTPEHRRRPAAARPGLRDRSGPARRGYQPIPDRGDRRARRRCPHSQPSPAHPVSRKRPARRAEPLLRAGDLVGDRNPREHEFVVQLRSFDSGKSGANLGVAVLIALCSALLGRSLKGGLAIVGGLNLGGSVELVHNPIEVMELAMEKGAAMVLLPVSSRRALVDLSDDVATRVQSLFYLDAADALRKALNEG